MNPWKHWDYIVVKRIDSAYFSADDDDDQSENTVVTATNNWIINTVCIWRQYTLI